ncbi:hypothetical protein WA026_019202 [Henosepilachna vigintioctopunctata]|uniref:TRAF-type domain-containing protein n=1 Tax=Henosepilachna vigintioctopunctata TaxID=420089 RepID=A0AAW1UWU6_9CUCU
MSSNVGVVYNKTPFVCYFCNKEIHGETELGHTAVCGSVLVPCMNKCGVYTPRSELANHNTKCPNIRKTSNPLSFQLQQLDPVLKDSNGTLSSRNNMVSEVRSLQNRCSVLEQYLSKLSTFNKNKTFIDSKELERLILQSKHLEEWKDIVNLKLENVKQQLIQQELSKSEAQENWKSYVNIF